MTEERVKLKRKNVKYTEEFLDKEAEALHEWIKNDKNVFLNKFALERGYGVQRITEFAQKNENFRDALEIAKNWQEVRMIEKAFYNVANSNFTKFLLINLHGFADRRETKISGDCENPFEMILKEINGKTKDLVDEAKEYGPPNCS